MSAEDNGSSEMGACQPMVVGRKLLPPLTPGGASAFVSEKQYDAIIRLRERRRRIKEARERRALKFKHVPKRSNGRFVKTKGKQEVTNEGIILPFGATPRDLTAGNGKQEVTTVGSEVQNSTPAASFYWPFVAINDGGENIGEIMYCPLVVDGGENVGDVAYDSNVPNNTPAMVFYWPFTGTNEYNGDISEAATSGSTVPVGYSAGDFYLPDVATNDEDENVSTVAYNSILNLRSPDPTTLLKMMMGNRYSRDQVSGQFQNVARLEAPEFATLLTVMNNAGYDESADNGHYDVNKVMDKLEGW